MTDTLGFLLVLRGKGLWHLARPVPASPEEPRKTYCDIVVKPNDAVRMGPMSFVSCPRCKAGYNSITHAQRL